MAHRAPDNDAASASAVSPTACALRGNLPAATAMLIRRGGIEGAANERNVFLGVRGALGRGT